MSRCYLLGAGASKGYRDGARGLPTTKEVFTRAEKIGLFSNPDFRLLRGILKEQNDISGKLEDPDDLTTDVETLLKTLNSEFWRLDQEERTNSKTIPKTEILSSGPVSASEIQTCLGTLYYLLYDLFRYCSSKYKPDNCNYVKLAEMIDPESDFVLTMNYDLLLEKALRHVGRDFIYNLEMKDENSVTVLKPHGSINLRAEIGSALNVPFEHIVSLIHSNKFADRNIEEVPLEEVENTWYRNLACGDISYFPVIMPPISSEKSYDMTHIYNQTWDECERKLRNVSEVVVIGCSLRKDDVRLINTLRDSLHPDSRVTIYTGGDSKQIAERVGQQIDGPICEAAGECPYFGDFIEERY